MSSVAKRTKLGGYGTTLNSAGESWSLQRHQRGDPTEYQCQLITRATIQWSWNKYTPSYMEETQSCSRLRWHFQTEQERAK